MERKDRDKFWQRKRGALSAPRREYRRLMKEGRAAEAHMTLVSPHLSVIKRWWWFPPMMIWHIWRMTEHAWGAMKGRTFFQLTPNEIDVLASALQKAPRRLGGSLGMAYTLLKAALDPTHPWARTMKSHTRALLLEGLAEVELKIGKQAYMVEPYYHQALDQEMLILAEPDEDRERQLVRVLFKAGLFFYDHFDGERGLYGLELLTKAGYLAKDVSSDQFYEILRQCKKRGLILKTELKAA